MKKLTVDEFLKLPFGSRIKVVWRYAKPSLKNKKEIFATIAHGHKIVYENPEQSCNSVEMIANCMFNGDCTIFIDGGIR